MTSKHIADQINTIRVATERANVSPEAALAFLQRAGIIPESAQVVLNNAKKIAVHSRIAD